MLQLYSPSKKPSFAIVQENSARQGIPIGGFLEEASPNRLFKRFHIVRASLYEVTNDQFRVGFVPGEDKPASEHRYSDSRISTGKYLRWILSTVVLLRWQLISDSNTQATAHSSKCSGGSWRSSIRVVSRHDQIHDSSCSRLVSEYSGRSHSFLKFEYTETRKR
jgi:hypothetical protein